MAEDPLANFLTHGFEPKVKPPQSVPTEPISPENGFIPPPPEVQKAFEEKFQSPYGKTDSEHLLEWNGGLDGWRNVRTYHKVENGSFMATAWAVLNKRKD